jgi:NADP-dependent 3-hydroxy acid dehydrogenase YdfG
MTLKGKTALVTGGGSGIGWAIAAALADAGVRVAIAGRRENQLQSMIETHKKSQSMVFHRVNVAHRGSVNQLVSWARNELGKIDILVNAAGINIKDRSMSSMPPEEWDQVMAINATGAYNCMHAVLPEMRERQDGLVINISSIAGKRASALGGIAYNASKFAMTALGVGAGNEENSRGIRITNVYPGEVNTPILEQRPVPVSEEHKQAILQPDDVAQLVLAIAQLPPRAHVPEVVIKPLQQGFF